MPLYLKINGIVGDSTDSEFSGWMEIYSFSWGASNPANTSSGTGGGAGKVSISDITISKTLSVGSPYITLDCCTGKHIPGAQIADVKSSKNGKEMTYLTYMLTNVLITSYQVSGDAGGSPSESFTLNFEKLQIDYTSQGASGPINEEVTISRDVIGA